MNFDFSDDQKMLRDQARRFLDPPFRHRNLSVPIINSVSGCRRRGIVLVDLPEMIKEILFHKPALVCR